MNLQLFDPNNVINKFSTIELKKFPFFLSCKKCYNVPEVILKDNKYIIITCPNCNIIDNENLENISNYSSKWISNEISNFCDCDSKHKEKIPSFIYCRECNIFLCQKCLKYHNEKNNNHDLVKLKDLKIGFCNQHNKKFLYYCNNCNSELCEMCKTVHNNHNLEKIKKKNYDGFLDLNKFESFLVKAEKIKREKYSIISESKTILENIFTEDKESQKLLNNTISDIIKEFYNDLKIEQNLIFFAKILFVTIKKFNKYDDFRVKQYKKILDVISQFFEPNEVQKFKNFIDKKKYIYKVYINKLSNEEKENIKRNIENIMNIVDKDGFIKIREFIENTIELSNPLKKYVMINKIKNQNDFINIDEILNNPKNLTKKINSRENSSLILSILCKYFEQNSFEIYASTKIDSEFENIELASFISLTCLGNIKKYELSFDFGEKQNNNLIYFPDERNNFLKSYKLIISKILGIDSNDLIFIFKDINENSIVVNAAIINEAIEVNKKMLKLKENDFIKKVEEKPILETIQINTGILDKRGDKIWKKDKIEIRGGLQYIQPKKDWIGIGIKVYNKYDAGNNIWLGKKNKDGEYAVAYSGLNFIFINKNNLNDIKNKNENNVNSIINNFLPFNVVSFLVNSLINSQSLINNVGICLFQDPTLAEENAGIVNIFGYKIMIMLMYRVNPKKIIKSKESPGHWIMNPTPDEIRPYRILLKIIPSLLTDKINISFSPIDYILSAFKSKNFSFYDLAKKEEYKKIATLNDQSLNGDFFSIRFYSSNNYSYLNNYLRSEDSLKENNNVFDKNQLTSWICCLQLALSRNKNVEDNIIVYRGISNFKFGKDVKKGAEFYFREFISTSLKESVAQGFIGENGTLMIINIKNNGSNGFPNYCYNIKDISMFPGEDEILISSHCCFEVNNMKRNKKIDEVYLTCKGFKIN